MMNKMNEWLQKLSRQLDRFMQGRNGMDDMTRALCRVILVILVLSLILGTGILNLPACAMLGYAVFRMVSTNIDARQRENVRYLNAMNALKQRLSGMRSGEKPPVGRDGAAPGSSMRDILDTMFPNRHRKMASGKSFLSGLTRKAAQRKLRFDERKEYRFFKCTCGTTLRCRRGQGTKELICPVCKARMTRNTD